jgi:hypothetical protein
VKLLLCKTQAPDVFCGDGLTGVATTAGNRREDDEIPKPDNHNLGSLLSTDLKCVQISRVI